MLFILDVTTKKSA